MDSRTIRSEGPCCHELLGGAVPRLEDGFVPGRVLDAQTQAFGLGSRRQLEEEPLALRVEDAVGGARGGDGAAGLLDLRRGDRRERVDGLHLEDTGPAAGRDL